MSFGTGFGGGASAYRQIAVETSVPSADPHTLILLLFEGAEAALHLAKGKMQEKDIPAKGKAISQAIQIVSDGLRASLDIEAGGEMAERLAALYDYVVARLLWANLKNDVAALDECLHLLSEIHSAWSQIAPAKQAAA
jgi:flagellar secretion chaperone FliS